MTVIVRFAPSPTGFLHLGGLRTALYNYLFAKQNKGLFLIRIEDTDQVVSDSRVVPSSIASILDILNWCKLKADRGPFKPEDYHLYLQSHRVDLYKQKAFELVEKDQAYRCFCTPMRLELLRREAAKNREKIGYDNRCRHLSCKEIDEKLSQKLPFTIRFKLKQKIVSFDDIVFGKIKTDLTLSESDPIILKSDSFPTYHLANVIDDHMMNISHVLRGTEWLHSTAKHLMIYEAFDWKPPQYAHLPLLLNQDNSKLSKRQDDLRIDQLRDKGYYANAIINFLVLSGGGFSKIKGNPIRSLEELVQDFQLRDINQNSCQLNLGNLYALNRIIISNKLKENENDLIQSLRKYLNTKFEKKKLKQFDDNYLSFIIKWSLPRIYSFNDLAKELEYVWSLSDYNFDVDEFSNLDNAIKKLEEIIDLILKTKINLIEGQTKSEVANFSFIKTYCEENRINYKSLMKLLRLSLINKDKGPPIGELFTVLGKDEFLKRLRNAIKYISDSSNKKFEKKLNKL